MIELELALRRGEFSLDLALASPARSLALFGPSGCGKTSTLLAIAGLLTPARGRIAFDREALFDSRAGIDLAPGRRGLGVVFQDTRLFPHLSVRDNLRYGAPRRVAGSLFDDVVELLELSALLRRRPGQLSGGQARRVAIGRALLRQPRALLLDEPLANLHREARAEVLQYLRELQRGPVPTTLLVSHQPDEVNALADVVARIGDGRLLALEDIAEFRAVTTGGYSQPAIPAAATPR